MTKPREEFIALLENSRLAVRAVASQLYKKGYNVRIVPNLTADSVEARWDYIDDGDIEITLRIEVKCWPNNDFKSLDDISWDEIIVDEVYKIDNRKHKSTLFSYVIVNASKTGCIYIPVWTSKHWFKKMLPDKREHAEREFYMIKKEHLEYRSLDAD